MTRTATGFACAALLLASPSCYTYAASTTLTDPYRLGHPGGNSCDSGYEAVTKEKCAAATKLAVRAANGRLMANTATDKLRDIDISSWQVSP